MKAILLKLERRLKKHTTKFRWLHDECPLTFLLLVWSICAVIGFLGMGLAYCGIITHEDFNIILSLLALLAAFILSIVVVL